MFVVCTDISVRGGTGTNIHQSGEQHLQSYKCYHIIHHNITAYLLIASSLMLLFVLQTSTYQEDSYK